MKTITDRIKFLRESRKLTQKMLAMELGLGKQGAEQSYIANIETSTNPPPSRFVIALKEKFNLSSNWLLYGEGDMYLSGEENTQHLTEQGLDDLCVRLKQQCLSMPEESRHYYQETLRRLVEDAEHRSQKSVENNQQP